jgi:hypothetical protein
MKIPCKLPTYQVAAYEPPKLQPLNLQPLPYKILERQVPNQDRLGALEGTVIGFNIIRVFILADPI